MAIDPYQQRVPVTELSDVAEALNVIDRHAVLNHRYRKLIEDSAALLGNQDIRPTQARGVAKKLLVLIKAAGPELAAVLAPAERSALDAGLAQANELIYASR